MPKVVVIFNSKFIQSHMISYMSQYVAAILDFGDVVKAKQKWKGMASGQVNMKVSM